MTDTGGDLKTQQFAQVLSAVPAGEPAVLRCRRFVYSATRHPALRALFIGLGGIFLILLIRPPFVLSFEYDKTRPWKACSRISWISVLIVAFLVAGAAAVVPCVC